MSLQPLHQAVHEAMVTRWYHSLGPWLTRTFDALSRDNTDFATSYIECWSMLLLSHVLKLLSRSCECPQLLDLRSYDAAAGRVFGPAHQLWWRLLSASQPTTAASWWAMALMLSALTWHLRPAVNGACPAGDSSPAPSLMNLHKYCLTRPELTASRRVPQLVATGLASSRRPLQSRSF